MPFPSAASSNTAAARLPSRHAACRLGFVILSDDKHERSTVDPPGQVFDLQELNELKPEHEEDTQFHQTVDPPDQLFDLQELDELEPEHEECAQLIR